MNKLLLLTAAAAIAVAAVTVAGPLRAYADSFMGNGLGVQLHQQTGAGNGSGYQSMLETRAQIVGMTADQLRTALRTKTMSQIAAEKGLTQEQFEAKMEAAVTARWQAMGLSSDEITQRLAEREQRQTENHATHEWGSGDGTRYRGGM